MTRARVTFLVLSAAIALGAWSVVHWLDETTLDVGVPPLVEAERATSGAAPPGDDADWRATTLPDDW